ncbi:hypothetical protein ACFWXK_11405 [Streptomyces sp. NPDC059070]|uniref:hypothetical protein n=1 Tax=Streptomyces sp. NPDC059070 TaxID=3346713 RepID=UPI0036778E28
MTKPIELVTFDYDAVLVDSERITARVQVAIGAVVGRPLTQGVGVERFIRHSHAAIRERAAARPGEAGRPTGVLRDDPRFSRLGHVRPRRAILPPGGRGQTVLDTFSDHGLARSSGPTRASPGRTSGPFETACTDSTGMEA